MDKKYTSLSKFNISYVVLGLETRLMNGKQMDLSEAQIQLLTSQGWQWSEVVCVFVQSCVRICQNLHINLSEYALNLTESEYGTARDCILI